MHWWASISGIVLIFIILMDAFETVVLPRRIKRHFRIASLFYKKTWRFWTSIGLHIKSANRREGFLAYYGPLSLIVLLGFWAAGLIFGFACVQYGLGEHVSLGNEKITFAKVVYFSGETFFTLGYGDITPNNAAARALAVMEAGMGFAFLGVVIGYLPVIYNSFAAREIEISLLDARAGSPPSFSAAWVAVPNRPCSTKYFATGSGGAPKSCRVTSPIRCWCSSARNIPINHGWAR